MDPLEPQNPNTNDAPAPEVSAAEQPEHVGSALDWRWVVPAIIVAILLLYPLVRRVLRPASTQSLITESYQDYQAGRFKEAVAAAEQVVARDPTNGDAYNNLAVSYAGLQQWDDAFKNAVKAVQLMPDSQLARNNLLWIVKAKVKQSGGQFPVATAPSSADDFVNRSLEACKAQQYKECVELAQSALKQRPDYAEAYNNIAVGLISLHRYDEAIAAAQTAVRLKPDFQLAKNNLAWAIDEKNKAAGKSK